MKSFWSQTSKKHLSLFHTLNLLWKVTSQNIMVIIFTVNKILEQCGDNCNQPKTSKNKLLTSITFIGLQFYRIILTRTMFKKTYMYVEIKKNFHHYNITNKITLKIPSLQPYYLNLNCLNNNNNNI